MSWAMLLLWLIGAVLFVLGGFVWGVIWSLAYVHAEQLREDWDAIL